jgi:hypothetical protein
VVYRCRVRTLLRAVGIVGGLAVVASPAFAEANVPSKSSKFQTVDLPMAETARSSKFDASKLQVIEGGADLEVVGGGDRVNPCTLGPANTYDRPPGGSPYVTSTIGEFNLDEFLIADDFTPAANGTLTSFCLRGIWSDNACAVDGPYPGIWTVNVYAFDFATGLPAALLTTYNTGPGGGMTVTQGTTGQQVGFANVSTEVALAFTVTGTPFNVTAGNCFYLEWFVTDESTCGFFQVNYSYENTQGNRSVLRRNDRFFSTYTVGDFINLDLTMSVGISGGVALGNSNGVGSCFERPAPANDILSASVPLVSCGTNLTFDNTYATYTVLGTAAFDQGCRRGTVDPTVYSAGDVWFRINPGANTSAQVSLCNTNLTTGNSGGDSIVQVFRLNNVANPPSAANFTQVACSDDGCGGGLSDAIATGLTANQVHYVRVVSFNPADQGVYRLDVTCPVTPAANDLCENAIDIPAVGNPGYSSVQGRQVFGTNRAGTVDTQPGLNNSCNTFGNTSRGVWFKVIGNGNEILASTDVALTGGGTTFDTTLAVYCGTCVTGNVAISCIAANDDFDPTGVSDKSEVTWCAKNGQTYWVLVQGFGLATGDFGLLVRNTRDNSNNLIPCCDVQDCGLPCEFEIPGGAEFENGFTGPNNGSLTEVTEPCNDTALSNATSFNNGCSNPLPPSGEERRFGTLAVGQTRTGNAWSWAQQFDRDWYRVTVLPNTRYLIDYSFAAEFPAAVIPWGWTSNFDACTGLSAQASGNSTPNACGFEFNRRYSVDVSGIAFNGTNPSNMFSFRVQNQAEDNYRCTGPSRYWLRLNALIPMSDCPALVVAPGSDDELTAPLFAGVGTDGEECIDPLTGIRHSGCNPGDNLFLRIRPGVPMYGKLDGNWGTAGGSRDVDWYKFTITGRNLVRIQYTTPWFGFAQILEDDCTADGESYALAASRGDCGPNAANSEDVSVLNGGTYIIVAATGDLFSGAGQTMFANLRCADSATGYRIDIEAQPLPTCADVCPTTPSFTETEVCGAEFQACAPDNDGCSEGIFGAQNVTLSVNPAAPTSICGSVFTVQELPPVDTFSQDVDYFQFTITSRQRLTFSAKGGPVQVFVADTGAPSGIAGTRDQLGGSNCYDVDNPLRVLDSVSTFDFGETAGAECLSATETVFLEPGTYSLIVQAGTLDQGLITTGYNCPANGSQVGVLNYSVSAFLEAVGSCCDGPDCTQTVQADCTGTPGNWSANTPCAPGYAQATSAVTYTTIQGTGGAVQVAGLTDDNSVAQTIPPFEFYGVTYTSIRVNANGYAYFSGDNDGVTPRTFPNTVASNAIIAPFWTDWQANAPGASVWIRSSGALGSETTIIEWRNVATQDLYSRTASFQIHLLRGGASDGRILFVYGPTSNLQFFDLADASAGIEDAAGLTGVNVTIDAGFRTGNRAFQFSKEAAAPCSAAPVCCPGDADGSGGVNFTDITTVLANFGATTPGGSNVGGDADCSGQVNFTDITTVLANFGATCN